MGYIGIEWCESFWLASLVGCVLIVSFKCFACGVCFCGFFFFLFDGFRG